MPLPAGVPAPAPDPHSVLLMVGDAGRAWPAAGPGDWSDVRRLDADMAGRASGGPIAGCACCVGRSRLAVSLSELFQQRARGRLGLFREVLLAVPAGELRAAQASLAADPLIAARYRVTAALG